MIPSKHDKPLVERYQEILIETDGKQTAESLMIKMEYRQLPQFKCMECNTVGDIDCNFH